MKTLYLAFATILSVTYIAIANELFAGHDYSKPLIKIAMGLRDELSSRFRSALTEGATRNEDDGYWIN